MEIIGSSRLGEVGRYGVCTEGVDYGCGHFDRDSLVNMFDCWQNMCRNNSMILSCRVLNTRD